MSTAASSSLSASLEENLSDHRNHNLKKTTAHGGGPSTLAELLGIGNIASNYHPAADCGKPAELFSAVCGGGDFGMCAEILGCENGCNLTEDDAVLCSGDLGSPELGQATPHRRRSTAAVVVHGEFPPPLRNMRGRRGLRLKSRREGGRLVMTAAVAPATAKCHVAERGNGRLLIVCDVINEEVGVVGNNGRVEGEMVNNGVRGVKKTFEEKMRKTECGYNCGSGISTFTPECCTVPKSPAVGFSTN